MTTLAELDPDSIDMKCLLIIGASGTRTTRRRPGLDASLRRLTFTRAHLLTGCLRG